MDNNSEVKNLSVGIITFHRYSNYGTMLQALSLERIITKCGYNSELIDFDARQRTSKKSYLIKHAKRIPYYFVHFQKYYMQKRSTKFLAKKNEICEKYHEKYLKVGKQKYLSYDEILKQPPEYDGYVVGSDQTWNPNVSGNPEAFYLTFVNNKQKCGSYAPSVTVNSITEAQEERMRQLLEHITWLSCREKEGALIIERITGRKCKNVLDPTLLLDGHDWSCFEEQVEVSQPYILEYMLGENKEHRISVQRIADEKGLKIINISTTYLDFIGNMPHIVNPGEFLWLIHHATLVCTDSFHGTAFSVNYNKPFIAFERYANKNHVTNNTRMFDFLSMVGLEDRIFKNQDCDWGRCSFEEANIKLAQAREDSMQYLTDMLISITAN